MLRDPSLIPLSHDHHHALALCVQLRRTLANDREDPPDSLGLQQLARQIVAHFDTEMRAHFRQEEELIFPPMSAFPSTRDLVIELTAEHRQLTELTQVLRSAAPREAILQFSEVLTQHVRKEENVLFQDAQQLLRQDQLDAIGALLASARTVSQCSTGPTREAPLPAQETGPAE